ncbi:MAG: metallophosphoesterase [Planctomycetota bacterium]
MQTLRQAPRRHPWVRLAFFRTCRTVAAALGGRFLYRWWFLRPGRIHSRTEVVEVPGLPAELHGLVCAHISDLHAGPFFGRGALAGVQHVLEHRVPDLLLLGGDYITDRWTDVLPLQEEFARLPRRLGAFAAFGNHDYRKHEQGQLVRLLGEAGITVLQDAGQAVPGLPLWIAGWNDLEESPRLDGAAARAGRGAERWEIGLCHHPRGLESLADPRCMVLLAGHSHGRQIDLPWLRHLGPAHPGLRVRRGRTTLLCNRGLGVVGLPLRYRAPAEVLFVELRDPARA